MEMIPSASQINDLKNEDLANATKVIICNLNQIRRNFYRIAAVMADVSEYKWYVDDGFKDAAEYASKVFNMRKSAAYDLIKIGNEYTNRRTENESNLPHKDGKDFEKSQIVAMLPLGHKTAVDLITAGTISPDQSVRQIKEVVRNNKAAEKIISGEAYEEEPEPDPGPGEGQALEDYKMWSLICYSDGYGNIERIDCWGSVPEGIAEAATAFLKEEGVINE